MSLSVLTHQSILPKIILFDTFKNTMSFLIPFQVGQYPPSPQILEPLIHSIYCC